MAPPRKLSNSACNKHKAQNKPPDPSQLAAHSHCGSSTCSERELGFGEFGVNQNQHCVSWEGPRIFVICLQTRMIHQLRCECYCWLWERFSTKLQSLATPDRFRQARVSRSALSLRPNQPLGASSYQLTAQLVSHHPSNEKFSCCMVQLSLHPA